MPTLEISQKLLDKLNNGEEITIKPPKKKFELEQLDYCFTNGEVMRKDLMNKMNRISQMAHQLGGEKEFVDGEENWSLSFGEGKFFPAITRKFQCVGKVYMTEECAIEICRILNSGEFELTKRISKLQEEKNDLHGNT